MAKYTRITKNLEGIIGAKASGSAEEENLIVPIIAKNDVGDIVKAATDESNVNSILVLDHGLYVFGEKWQQAKAICETLELLFELELTKEPEAKPEPSYGLLHGK
ncbi:methylthioribulose-1-phosphate dehydratase-like [Sitodiplosis mosellana]|uniref:methylthioribulose-1-phosphate dehydratase-like n=1 Tax=Sitodiplosis mosellana TaxID=263140 RepID=UPI002444DE35|nr:methylthioribulose-1-phosphate dehydratase-like [Sitodiplosis mosellana]